MLVTEKFGKEPPRDKRDPFLGRCELKRFPQFDLNVNLRGSREGKQTTRKEQQMQHKYRPLQNSLDLQVFLQIFLQIADLAQNLNNLV